MIEARIYTDPTRCFEKSIGIIKKENGKIYYAKPIDIEWVEFDYIQQFLPMITVQSVGLADAIPSIEGRYEQIREDKKEHISNLNEIIKLLLENK